jgi:hypothetical protein
MVPGEPPEQTEARALLHMQMNRAALAMHRCSPEVVPLMQAAQQLAAHEVYRRASSPERLAWIGLHLHSIIQSLRGIEKGVRR